ncbi:MAG TPA: inositol-3-phosphate synthase, partial [Planctomycetia bacterium]|nr:inositol-3-phosphate synthase [Planctomycetia bacterium]
LQRKLAPPVALTTMLDPFAKLPFCDLGDFVVGGHDVRKSDLNHSALELHRSTAVFNADILSGCRDLLADWSANVRPGLVRNSGRPVEAFADWTGPAPTLAPKAQIDALAADIRGFAQSQKLRHVIVVNVSSSEPMPKVEKANADWATWDAALKTNQPCPLPASSLYGLAAIEAGASYVNFTPSLGLDLPGLEERAKQLGAIYMGKDGKTGETLMKSVLGPMFARRNLHVMSWVGHNILGNRDGLVLQDPANKQGKVESKDRLLTDILGYQPQTLVTIEYIESMGDRKTAWDHIHFQGFLGTPMTLQFIWQGVDSLLAAPLIVDLLRWTEFARAQGERGCLEHLACYFKSPMHVAEQDFFRQYDALEAYTRRHLGAD